MVPKIEVDIHFTKFRDPRMQETIHKNLSSRHFSTSQNSLELRKIKTIVPKVQHSPKIPEIFHEQTKSTLFQGHKCLQGFSMLIKKKIFKKTFSNLVVHKSTP